MTYQEAVQFLYSLGNEVQTAKLGLERISRLLEALGNPHRQCRFVHVAGTNGKGSTCAMIEAGLRAAGVRTGLYTSPHLVEPIERLQISGAPVSRSDFANAFDRVHSTALSAGLDMHPTYFETITAMGFLLFAQAQCELVVLETGLGGRLDATNVVDPELCVITPIDFDHQRFLGDTLASIAAEKAGILKPGVPAVFAHQHPEAQAVLRSTGVAFDSVDGWPVEELAITPFQSQFRSGPLKVTCPLAGEHQVGNALTAAIALHKLGYPVDGIAQTRWPGRLEFIGTRYLLDGAHNPSGAAALALYIRSFWPDRPLTLIFGVMRDKAAAEMAGTLFPLARRVIVTAPRNERALKTGEIPWPETETAPGIESALELSRSDDFVLIAGSLFLVGEARSLLVQ